MDKSFKFVFQGDLLFIFPYISKDVGVWVDVAPELATIRLSCCPHHPEQNHCQSKCQQQALAVRTLHDAASKLQEEAADFFRLLMAQTQAFLIVCSRPFAITSLNGI